MAGRLPSASWTGAPPVRATDSILPMQPCRTAKYTVPWATEISSPITPLGTIVLVTAPLLGLSVTSAPAAVTATMPGSAEAGAGDEIIAAHAGGVETRPGA